MKYVRLRFWQLDLISIFQNLFWRFQQQQQQRTSATLFLLSDENWIRQGRKVHSEAKRCLCQGVLCCLQQIASPFNEISSVAGVARNGVSCDFSRRLPLFVSLSLMNPPLKWQVIYPLNPLFHPSFSRPFASNK